MGVRLSIEHRHVRPCAFVEVCQQETMPSRLDNSDSALYMRHEELEFFMGG